MPSSALKKLYFIRDIVLQLFAALLLMTILNPIVKKLSKIKIPKTLSVLVSYILIFGVFGFAIGILLPPLVEQTTNLANNLPKYFQDSGITNYANGDVLKEIVSQLGSVPSQVIKAGFSFFTNILNILTVLIFAFYLLLIRDKFEKNLERPIIINYFKSFKSIDNHLLNNIVNGITLKGAVDI